MKKLLLCSAFLLLIISQTSAQFSFKGEYRPRFEYRGGYSEMLSNDEKPVLTISQRTRLSAYYQTGIFSFGLGIQDIRVWGDDNIYSYTGVSGSTSSIDLNEGWIGIKPYKSGFLKIGRQYWIYEDERLLSMRGWNQGETKYDAILFQHIGKGIQVDAGLSWNNMQEKTFGNEYTNAKMKTLNFLYLKKQVNDWLYISAMGVASGFTTSDTTPEINVQGTYGLYLGVYKGNLKALASGFYQNGKNRTGLTTSAFLFSAKADYLVAKKFPVGAGIDYISGTDQKNTDPDYMDKNHSFDNLYGVRHRILGHLDYFNNLPKSTGNGGIMDIYLKLGWNFVPTASAGIDLHYFSLQNNVSDKTSEVEAYLSKGLGQETDIYFSWDMIKFVNVRGGYSFFLATDSMEKLQGVYGNARFPGWIWVMITAKPVFFETAAK